MRQRFFPFLTAVVGLLGPACSDDGAPRDQDIDGGRTIDSARSSDGGEGLLPARAPARDAGPSRPPLIAAGSDSQCNEQPLPAPRDLCEQLDTSEPNSQRSPATLTLEPSCSLVSALAADKDEDSYRFVPSKSDPVLIELSYVSANRADLAIDIRDKDDRSVARVVEPRTGPNELIRKVLRTSAGISYDVQVDGANIGLCQPYALRVDARYCSDGYEDNDSEGSATVLQLRDDQKVDLDATASEHDLDYYRYTAPKADPVRISGSYTANSEDSVVLRRLIGARNGIVAIDEAGGRSGPTATFAHWLRSPAPDTEFVVQIAGEGSGCARYKLEIDTVACSDPFEDNESAEAAAKLPLGEPVSATIFYGDPDFYDLRELDASLARGEAARFDHGGSCTLSYTLDEGSNQRLSAQVRSASAGIVASSVGAGGTSSSKTLELRWPNPDATTLEVTAEAKGACQSYTLHCTGAAPPQ